jgi:thiol-disulfide isomerase/thioredoxin
MKKGLFIAAGVVALLAVMVWADRKFPAASSPSAGTPMKPIDAPTVALKDLNDKDVTLQQYKGEVLLVNFWATWCAPCKSEIPLLIGLHEKYGSRGFEILGLSMDEDGKKVVQPFLDKERFDVGGQKEPINYPIAFANDSIGEKFGGVMGLPTSLLLARDGKVIKRIIGPIELSDISKDIENLL